MWKPSLNFITIHYTWIFFCSLLSFLVLSPYGNLQAIDVLFFGCSSSTESGLNTVDVKDLKTYQQVFLYVVPIITNLLFVNTAVVVIRLYWFRKHLKSLTPNTVPASDPEEGRGRKEVPPRSPPPPETLSLSHRAEDPDEADKDKSAAGDREEERRHRLVRAPTTITFDDNVKRPPTSSAHSTALRIPGPRARDLGQPIIEVEVDGNQKRHGDGDSDDELSITPATGRSGLSRRRAYQPVGPAMMAGRSIEKVAGTLLVLGPTPSQRQRRRSDTSTSRPPRALSADLPRLSQNVTVGRNSQFRNLTEHDREILGGVEYRSLKLLLKIISSYFFGLHLFGVICLLPWILTADAKYLEVLDTSAISHVWWAFYTAQTMVNNLGFTLTPDSMSSFKDATWPMLSMTFLAFAGNTCYPIFLRFIIWIMSKVVRKSSETQESLQFLLNHPRRCYTLLFPSKPTWILFGILVFLNAVDVIFIITLDLHNEAVIDLPIGPRILSALFQAASARHTGTATLNLSRVNPGVQFSLLCMMYIGVFPISISIRASNTYEEKALGLYHGDEDNLDEGDGKSYMMAHIRNQLSFDMWYIFLGTFCICCAESERIMKVDEPAFSVFSVFFEVVSAYGNVGLSLGHPAVMTSLSGQFTTFAKFVLCAMMIRGRHRGLPYALDRAIMLPSSSRAIAHEGDQRPRGRSSDAARRSAITPAGTDDLTLSREKS